MSRLSAGSRRVRYCDDHVSELWLLRCDNKSRGTRMISLRSSRRRSCYPGPMERRVFCHSSGSIRGQDTWRSRSRDQARKRKWLFVHLNYPDGEEDNFEWQLFTPARMISMAESVGLRQLPACAAFDETTPPSLTNPACNSFSSVLAPH
jgi:hypothetical protein